MVFYAKIFDEEFGIEGYIDQKGVYHEMSKREDRIPGNISINQIIDYEKEKGKQTIIDKRPTISIDDITDPERK